MRRNRSPRTVTDWRSNGAAARHRSAAPRNEEAHTSCPPAPSPEHLSLLEVNKADACTHPSLDSSEPRSP